MLFDNVIIFLAQLKSSNKRCLGGNSVFECDPQAMVTKNKLAVYTFNPEQIVGENFVSMSE